jgi:two-component system nitrate/nitrite response regulator NarL
MSDQGMFPRSILVVDDHVLFRDGLISLFRSTPDFHVVDQAGTVQEAIEKASFHRPDIILMDFSLPDGTGLDATQAILDELPDCKIVFLTVYETDENLLKAIRQGAKGYLLKNVSSSSLLASLRSLASGELAMSRRMMSRALEFSRSLPVSQGNRCAL